MIGSAVLSLTPEECDANLADLYLPIIEECNDRSWYGKHKKTQWVDCQTVLKFHMPQVDMKSATTAAGITSANMAHTRQSGPDSGLAVKARFWP